MEIKDITIEQTTAKDIDYLVLQNPETGIAYKITKANLLAGSSSGSGSTGGSPSSTLPPSTVFASHFDGTIPVDVKGNNIELLGSAKTDSSINLLSGSALLIDGNGWASIANNSAFSLGSANFSLEFFINFLSSDSGALINRYGNTPSAFVIQAIGGTLQFYIHTGSYVGITGIPYSPGTLYYMGIKRESEKFSAWMNGIKVGECDVIANVTDTTSPILIGAEPGGTFKGKFRLDEIIFRIGNTKDLSVVPTVPFS